MLKCLSVDVRNTLRKLQHPSSLFVNKRYYYIITGIFVIANYNFRSFFCDFIVLEFYHFIKLCHILDCMTDFMTHYIVHA